jgi:hypothetical protein
VEVVGPLDVLDGLIEELLGVLERGGRVTAGIGGVAVPGGDLLPAPRRSRGSAAIDAIFA